MILFRSRKPLPKGTVFRGNRRRVGVIAVQTAPQLRSIQVRGVGSYFVALPSLIFVVSYYDLLFRLKFLSLRVFMANGPLGSPSDLVNHSLLPMHTRDGAICMGTSISRRYYRDLESLTRGAQGDYWVGKWAGSGLARCFECRGSYVLDLAEWARLTRLDRDMARHVDWVNGMHDFKGYPLLYYPPSPFDVLIERKHIRRRDVIVEELSNKVFYIP